MFTCLCVRPLCPFVVCFWTNSRPERNKWKNNENNDTFEERRFCKLNLNYNRWGKNFKFQISTFVKLSIIRNWHWSMNKWHMWSPTSSSSTFFSFASFETRHRPLPVIDGRNERCRVFGIKSNFRKLIDSQPALYKHFFKFECRLLLCFDKNYPADLGFGSFWCGNVARTSKCKNAFWIDSKRACNLNKIHFVLLAWSLRDLFKTFWRPSDFEQVWANSKLNAFAYSYFPIVLKYLTFSMDFPAKGSSRLNKQIGIGHF